MQSKMIVVEGIDGAGKGMVIAHVAKLLAEMNINVITTREPGGTPKAELIRDILKGEGAAEPTRQEKLFPLTELMLFYAARHQHVEGLIKPALAKGNWVLSDRFNLSSWAYQGMARQLPFTTLQTIDDLSLRGFAPDVTIFLDLPPTTAQTRQATRDDNYKDSIEEEGLSFQERCRKGYMQVLEINTIKKGHVIIIDASKSALEVCAQVTENLTRYIKSDEEARRELKELGDFQRQQRK